MKHILYIILLMHCISNAQDKNDYISTLTTGWVIQSSEKVNLPGDKISSAGFSTEGWYTANVPSTVLAALVKNGIYKDIFYGENLKLVPKEQFQKSWWYRNKFKIPADNNIKTVKIKFDGINYYANIWLNGKLVAGKDTVCGAFRQFEFDVTGITKTGEDNILAVEVFPPLAGDYTIGFVDWNPTAPDKNMGIWREVKLELSGDVSVFNPYVSSKLDCEGYKSAELTISAEVKNYSAEKVTGILEGTIELINFNKEVVLEPGESKTITFTPEEYKQLTISNPRVWWTHDLGKQELYNLSLVFKINGNISSQSNTRFGIREVTDYFTVDGYRGYKLNGKRIVIRGGGWVDNMLLDNTYNNIVTQVEYAVHMNLNTLRLEGFWGSNENLYNLCDEKGILMMVGWSCQWEWEAFLGKQHDDYGGIMSPSDFKLLVNSWKDQIIWLRNHPSIFVWLYGSDKYPSPEIEKEYVKILSEYDPGRPFLASAGNKTTTITGNTGVKMTGPYDYVPPVYWYTDTIAGGAFGFNSETGPGVQVPVISSIKKFIPANHLWPIDSIWNYHCGGLEFKNLNRFTDAMNQRLGKAASLEEYCTKAAFMNYEGMRAMYEAFISNKYKSTGVIQWMYNAAWPKFWWQLYDYYLVPNAAFYGARKANEPVHILYDYGDKGVKVVNNTYSSIMDMIVTVKVYNYDLSVKFAETFNVNIEKDTCIDIVSLAGLREVSPAYFANLNLYTKAGKKLSSNFYCLSTKEELLDYSKHDWFVTPTKQYTDFTMLNDLPVADITYNIEYREDEENNNIIVNIKNLSKYPAVQTELQVLNESGNIIVPVFWEDNYITILPGETIMVTGYYKLSDYPDKKPKLKVTGWNIKSDKIRY